jgi:cytochrome c biogenesis protein CcmG, thiol:disulfide interchange protein DsbE
MARVCDDNRRMNQTFDHPPCATRPPLRWYRAPAAIHSARLLVAVMACAVLLHAAPGNAQAAPRPAPEIDNATELFSASPVSLRQYRGKLVLLEFWASWCGPCWRSFPVLNQLQERYRDRGLVILAVSVDEDVADARDYAERKKPVFALLHDPAGKVADRYHVDAMPQAFLIDEQGLLLKSFIGFNDSTEKQLAAALRARLGE